MKYDNHDKIEKFVKKKRACKNHYNKFLQARFLLFIKVVKT